ncbi:MAG: hypothetical protein KDA78_20850, partial [Planctomycetaceae bacterium]|nr:hypothetical protein [Planctomycetaceae bacterium]
MRLLLFLTVITLPIPAVAQPAFNQFQAAKKIAAEVAHEIGLNNEVFVREFRGIGETHVGLSKLVSNALQRNHDINNRRGASCEVDGRIFRYPIDESQPIEGFTIQVNVILPVGERKISIDVSNVDEGMILVGKSSELAAPPSKPQGSA